MKKVVAVLLVLFVMAASRGAGAAEPEAQREREPEVLLGVGQELAGVGVAVAGLALAGVIDIGSPGAGAVLLATPFAVGAAVCGVGKWSKDNQGSCGAAIGAAYLGMLSIIPLALLGYQLDVMDGGGGEFDGLGGIFLGMAVGWLVVQPLAATVTWHLTKRPRPEAVALVPTPSRLRAFAPPVPRHGSSRAPGQMTLTLLSTRF